MDSPNNLLNCSNTTLFLNGSPHISLPPSALPFVAEPDTHSATNAVALGYIYERLPTAWAEMSEAEKAETVGWVEVFGVEGMEFLIKRCELFILCKNKTDLNDRRGQETDQVEAFHIFMENGNMMLRINTIIDNCTAPNIYLVNGREIQHGFSTIIGNNSYIRYEKAIIINSKYTVTKQPLGRGGFGEV
ncbi:hypothetical protein BDF19DRAFT_415295 [Syncephalis fuscata]|nr:hypothetical protein BDF19DRAFT_415295 [Syncephalis fuscata]